MANVVNVGREIDPVFDSVTGNLTGISSGTLGPVNFVTATSGATSQLPGATVGTFGGGTATFGLEGNVNVQVSSTGVSPGATGADNVVAVYTIPANSFSAAGKGITVTAQGSFAANGNTKTVKLIFNPATAVVGSTVGAGGTVLSTTGAVTQNGGGWSVSGNVFKYGAANSNTQITTNNGAVGATHFGTTAPILSTATENAAILVAVTGNAATTASDIVFNVLEVNVTN